MNLETLINQNQIEKLFNINKTNEKIDINFKSITNNAKNKSINYERKFDKGKIFRNINSKNKSNIFKYSFKKIEKNKLKPFDIQLTEDRTQNSNILKSDSNIDLTSSKIVDKEKKPTNIINSFESRNNNFIELSKTDKKSLFNKKIRINKNAINSNIIKEENNKRNEKLFSTEIEEDNSNTNNTTNINMNIFNNINNANINSNSQNRNSYSNRNYSTDNNNKNKNKLDPLIIPEEDMIFEEMKNYKCFKYFTRESLIKTGVPFIYINMDMNNIENYLIFDKKNNDNDILENNEKLKSLIDRGNEQFILNKKEKPLSNEKKKEIIEKVYRIETSPDFYENIEKLKQKKKKKLKGYQNNFLKLVKNNITDEHYDTLKNKFNKIRDISGGKYNTNYKFLREIEKNEEGIIKNINELHNYYMKFFATKNINKLFIKSIGPRIKLPEIKFIKTVKKRPILDDIKINKKTKKRNFINLKKYISKTNTEFNKNTFDNIQNKEKNSFSFTNYNQFKSFSSKKL